MQLEKTRQNNPPASPEATFGLSEQVELKDNDTANKLPTLNELEATQKDTQDINSVEVAERGNQPDTELKRKQAFELFCVRYNQLPDDRDERKLLEKVAKAVTAFAQRFSDAAKKGESVNLLGIERQTKMVSGKEKTYYIDTGWNSEQN